MASDGTIEGGIRSLNRLQKAKISSSDRPFISVFASNPDFLGSRGMLKFGGGKGEENSVYVPVDEWCDEYSNPDPPEKKRRLSVEKVEYLEKCFEEDNKLEADRKIQLAKELKLQPRQIAIWFQNRRARWKTRQLETDYQGLHTRYERLKGEYDKLVQENEKLKAEVLCLNTSGAGTENPAAKQFLVYATCKDNESTYGDDSAYDEWTDYIISSETHVSHCRPDGTGFFFEDPAFSFWSC